MSFITPQMCNSIGNDLYGKLQKSHLLNVMSVITATPEEIIEKTHCSFKEIMTLKTMLLSTKSSLPVSGDDLYEDVLNNAAILSTGCESLNAALDGGLYTSEVTELCGGPGMGKTQLCMNSAVSVSVETSHSVVYIDTGTNLDATRLQDIVSARVNRNQATIADVCRRIVCYRASDVFQLLSLLETLRTSSCISGSRLVIVDSLTPVLAPLQGGACQDGMSYTSHIGRSLLSLASECCVAVLVSNSSVTDFHSGETKPALGKSWASVPHNRVMLSANHKIVGGVGGVKSANERRAKVLKTVHSKTGGEVGFVITDSGVGSGYG